MNPIEKECCNHCSALFCVTEEQLRAAEGWLRCGDCGHIFQSPQTDLYAVDERLKANLVTEKGSETDQEREVESVVLTGQSQIIEDKDESIVLSDERPLEDNAEEELSFQIDVNALDAADTCDQMESEPRIDCEQKDHSVDQEELIYPENSSVSVLMMSVSSILMVSLVVQYLIYYGIPSWSFEGLDRYCHVGVCDRMIEFLKGH